MEKKVNIPVKMHGGEIELPLTPPEYQPPMSHGMSLLSRALVNVEQILIKNEEALTAVKEQLTKLSNQRIGLLSQKNMLVELKLQLEKDETENVNQGKE